MYFIFAPISQHRCKQAIGQTGWGVITVSGRYDEAVRQLDAVLEMDPEFPAAHLWRGRSLQELGQHDAAIAAF